MDCLAHPLEWKPSLLEVEWPGRPYASWTTCLLAGQLSSYCPLGPTQIEGFWRRRSILGHLGLLFSDFLSGNLGFEGRVGLNWKTDMLKINRVEHRIQSKHLRKKYSAEEVPFLGAIGSSSLTSITTSALTSSATFLLFLGASSGKSYKLRDGDDVS